MVVLMPVYSKGTDGGCYIELPGGPATLQVIGDHIAAIGLRLARERNDVDSDAA